MVGIGIAMYTVHRAVETDMRDTFTKLSDMGYRGIEFYGEPENFPEENVKGALRTSGMTLTGWHLDWRRLHKEAFSSTVQHLQGCGCDMAVVQCLGGKWNVGHDQKGECEDRWLYYAEWLNQVSGQLKNEGIRLAYHNHEHEFCIHYGEKSVYDILYENLSSDIVMEKYRDRQLILHLKPYGGQKGFDVMLGDASDENDWDAMLHQSRAGFEWLLVESENRLLPEMENAAMCIERLRGYL